jgi:hypothetical protein
MCRASSPFLAVLCGLIFGCHRPTQDQPLTTGDEVAPRQIIAPVAPRVSEAEEAAITAILALVENEDEQKKVLTLGSGGHVVRVNLSGISTANNDTLN